MKTIILIFSTLLVFTLTGCKDGDEEQVLNGDLSNYRIAGYNVPDASVMVFNEDTCDLRELRVFSSADAVTQNPVGTRLNVTHNQPTGVITRAEIDVLGPTDTIMGTISGLACNEGTIRINVCTQTCSVNVGNDRCVQMHQDADFGPETPIMASGDFVWYDTELPDTFGIGQQDLDCVINNANVVAAQ